MCAMLVRVLILLSLSIVCVGCGDSAQDMRELCDAQVRLAAVTMVENSVRKNEKTTDYEKSTNKLRKLLATCRLPSDGLLISQGWHLSAAQILVMASLFDEARMELADVRVLSAEEQSSLLITAAHFGSLMFLEDLIALGVRADLTDEAGNNALSAIVHSPIDAEEKTVFLVNQGVDPFQKNVDNFSALDASVLAEDLETVTLILSVVSSKDAHNVEGVLDALTIAKRMESPAQARLETWLAQP